MVRVVQMANLEHFKFVCIKYNNARVDESIGMIRRSVPILISALEDTYIIISASQLWLIHSSAGELFLNEISE